MELTVINREELPREANSFELAGYLHGIAELSLIWVEMSPGDQVALHQHPYGEIFVIVEGQALFTVGTTQLVAHAGQIVLAPPNTPHQFANNGAGLLCQLDIHLSPRFSTEWC